MDRQAPLVALLLALIVGLCECLRLVMVDLPTAANVGEGAELSCVYELDGDRLHSIKWYKDDIEFYRYVPNDWPPGQFLPLPGVKVDLSKSDRRSVFLKGVDLNSTGTYRCEVTAEAPSFQTVEAERRMNVVVLPKEGPRIVGGQPQYGVGDTVSLNCTSARSKPAPTLRWFVNNLLAGPDYETEHSTTLHSDGLESASLSLRFVAREQHFEPRSATMRLRCTASVARAYTMFDEGEFPRLQTSPLHAREPEPEREQEQRQAVVRAEKPIQASSIPKKKEPEHARTSSQGGSASLRIPHWAALVLPTVALLRQFSIT